MRGQERPGRRELAVAVGTIMVLVLAVTWPVLGRPDQLALGSPLVDLPAKLWTLWWWVQPDRQALVNHPVGGVDLYLLTPVSGLLTLALGGRVVLAHNLAVALAVAAAVLGGTLWGRRLGGAAGGLVGGAALGTAPALLDAINDGTGEFTWIGMVALSMWACDRLAAQDGAGGVLDRGRVKAMLLAAVILAATAASCWYHGLAAGLGVALHALARPSRRVALPRVLLAGGLGLLLVLPLARQFAGSSLEPDRVRASDLVSQVLEGAAGPEPDHAQDDMSVLRRTQLIGSGDAPQPLWPVATGGLLLAWMIGGSRRVPGEPDRRRALRTGRALPLLAPGLVALVLSLGSTLPGGTPLPMLPINRLLAWFGTPLHLPFHFGALTTVVVVGLAALAAQARPRLALVAGGVLLLGLLGPGRPLPMPVLHVEAPAPLVALAQQEGAVVSLPALLTDAQDDLDSEALRQMIHQRPIGGVPIFPTSMLAREGVQQARQTELLRALAGQWRADGTPPATDDLVALGYRWVVVDLARAPQLARVLERWLGPAWAEGDGLRVYALR